jgi:predicted metal-dependent hydrolase
MFTVQPLQQDWSQPLPKYWLDSSPFKSHLMNGMGITFPIGEKFFIDSIRPYKDTITDSVLQKEIKEFIKQENWHSYAHEQYNKWLAEQSLPVDKIYTDYLALNNWVQKHCSNRIQLAITICFEHITAIMARNALRNRSFYRLMDPHFEEIWRWHNVEEVEHKAVTMDVWKIVDDNQNTLRWIMICATIVFWYKALKYTIILLHADKQLWRWRNIADAWDILFAKNGIIRAGVKEWSDFFRKNFHPNDHDDTKLLKNYRKL